MILRIARHDLDPTPAEDREKITRIFNWLLQLRQQAFALALLDACGHIGRGRRAKLKTKSRMAEWKHFFESMAPTTGHLMLPHHGAAEKLQPQSRHVREARPEFCDCQLR